MVNIYDSDLFRINYLHVCHVYCKQVLQRIHVWHVLAVGVSLGDIWSQNTTASFSKRNNYEQLMKHQIIVGITLVID